MIHQGYIIKQHPNSPNLRIIVTEGRGGKIPNALAGSYTNDGVAISCIDEYLKTKGDQRGKTKANSKVKPA